MVKNGFILESRGTVYLDIIDPFQISSGLDFNGSYYTGVIHLQKHGKGGWAFSTSFVKMVPS